MNDIKSNHWDLEELIDPNKFQDNLDLSGYEKYFLLEILERMIIIRFVEEKLAQQREIGVIGGPVHLSAGQEAVAVGVSFNLSKTDRVFGARRSHSHLLAMEPCIHGLFAEVLGKDTGLSKGMGGSMHLINQDSGFYGSVPIVSGTVSLAVGASFDSLRNNLKDVGVAYLGDGAVEEGVVHESLNLASILSTPTIFIVENNLFSSHMHISLRQPRVSTARFAEANNIEYEVVDGNNVLEVFEVSKRLITQCKEKPKPKFIEAITFRHYGHVDWRKDVDVGVNRSQKDLDNWIKRDPIERLESSMLNTSLVTKSDIKDLHIKIHEKIEASWQRALEDPYPEDSQLLSRVYKND